MTTNRLGRDRRGFTLTELMITVAIIAILASIAIVGYGKYIQSARVTEGKNMMAAMLFAQTAYFNDFATYGSCAKNPPDPEPQSTEKKDWTTNICWQGLGVTPSAQRVSFQYQTEAGTGSCSAPAHAPHACSGISGGDWWWAMGRNANWIVYINSVNQEPWEVER